MRIAVCDDDESDVSVIRAYLARFDIGMTCDAYHSADELIDALGTSFYDLIFMDIEMGALNGYDAAKQIMEGAEKPLIVFVTKSSKYTIQGYEVAFRYLVKPLDYEDFRKVMSAALERIVPKKIAIDIGGTDYIFPVSDIYYFEIFGHRIRIRTADQTLICRNSLKNIEDMLTGGIFVRPHNSFLVNMEHVINVSQTELIVRDGTQISMSRKRKEEVLRALYQYLRR